ncbi:MAG TPA: heavy metal-binding domain-containing protein [Ideonella sp.]|uniref:YbjQ family protein n=1 Tax=Ideonella sp. TaxID=1929293 RepID=UPI002B9302C0|nr:heavy metal-binding domain-containing protein [Ideonella sp.]HSI50280.1 heavy metal-binding domain-containing protein [Ideonella sp.]
MPLDLILNLGLPIVLIVIGYLVGRALEQRHYASIRERERALQGVIALNTRFVPVGVKAHGSQLVSGGVVVSSDHFKTFVAGFRNLVGGRMRGYESLLKRGRREALLRMKQQARDAGCTLVIGVRFHTTRVAGKQTPAMEVMAYGTALDTRAE